MGMKMTGFLAVAELAERMAGTASRRAKRKEIAEAIATVRTVREPTHPTPASQERSPGTPDRDETAMNGAPSFGGATQNLGDVGLFCLYLAGMPFAEADARKLNAGGALLTKALLAVSGASQAELTAAYRRHGDLGAAGFDLLAAHPMSQVRDMGHPVSLLEVSEAFVGMAGAKTTAIRAGLVEGLLRRSTPLEAKYLLKLMLGDMRIGVKQSLVEEAIAVAAGVPVGGVRHAVMLEADLGDAAVRAFAGTLGEARMRLFHPLGFMLASPVETAEEAVARFTGAADAEVQAFLEDKYDGMRAQVHCGAADQPGRVAIYSRNREDITESYPELVEAFAGVSEELIFDGEILGWDFFPKNGASGQALPFAVLGQRIGRKRVGDEWRQKIPVVFMAFDLMFAAGELLLGLPLRERRNRLEAMVERLVDTTQSALTGARVQAGLFEEVEAERMPRLMIAPSRLVESAEDIDRAYASARARANEGVMLKAADSVYQPGRRGLAWVKLKRELATLDVVITGAEYGHGKRAGLLSDYTFAVRNAAGELENVGKAYSGVTDAEIAGLTEFLKAHTLEEFGHFRTVEPLVVLEVAFNNVMRSDRHASGFALRFPRILRIRNDKPLEEIDTVERVEEIYQSQVDKPVEEKR